MTAFVLDQSSSGVDGLLAQLVARSLDMGEVTSSSLVQTTILVPFTEISRLQCFPANLFHLASKL
jgi:hypothetical protein